MRGRGLAMALGLLLATCHYDAAPPSDQRVADREPFGAPAGSSSSSVPAAAMAPTGKADRPCLPGEEPVFACKVRGGQRLAVCAPARGSSKGKTRYRFGGDRPEVSISGGEWASTAYSGGGEAQIAFVDADTRHIVFSRVVRTNFTPGEPNDPALSDGVIVERGGKVIAVHLCDDPDVLPVQYAAAGRSLPKAGDLFTYDSGQVDR
jgi:hypothetical protein